MSFWDWLFREPYDKYALFAREQIELIRLNDAGPYSANQNARKEGIACKVRIASINWQGGLENHKYALAMWQISKALYPDAVTDADRPTLAREVWKDI